MVDLSAIEQMRSRLRGKVRLTPLLIADSLTADCSCSVYLKAETFQFTHSFKVRAAYGALLPRLEEARKRGVVAGSSGNFAQGLAYAGRELGVAVTIVMMESSSPYKVEAARRLGAEIVFCPSDFPQRAATVERIVRQQGKLPLSSYDDEGTVLGNGSLGLELAEQLPDLEEVLVPASGGGLLAGVAAAVKLKRPHARVYGVQPEVLPAVHASLKAGRRTSVPVAQSVADGIVANIPGEVTFPLIEKYVDDVLLVSEAEIIHAMAHLFRHEKLVVEPSGSLTVAALRRYWPARASGSKVVAVLSGGNIQPSRFLELVSTHGATLAPPR